ncbi:SDR family NAD(P)-dependent oxidoreductase [Shewanella surugensis]|uniref:SDR family NAD(P)-dependent oxidoreductase n=1 Tax=Shewanella surugensis TaxID=212020 RepID=A0ABT0LG88_9GAMM|nr:SDR family NAD(P)-dependent oxidoreductase [Shewanella surugensis]MCL1126688.1 SDR family NAD(P)-dependent oxidoreductase [Shewanella surugensis]
MIVITGASSGLGAALAKCYAQDNEALFLNGRNAQRLDRVAHQIQSKKPIQAHVANLSVPNEIKGLFDALPQAPKMLLHCAGSGLFGPIAEQDPNEIKQLIDNNVTACILVLQEAIKRYKNKPLTLVVVMSSAAQTAKANESTYCAVKWAVKGLISALRLELKSSPIKIIAVYPGGMNTDFWPTSGKALDTSSFMQADEVAYMLKQALISSDNGYISDISIDRG